MNHNEIPEKPILMSGPMVLAILADHKTQTRRILKTALTLTEDDECLCVGKSGYVNFRNKERRATTAPCKYGLPGERLVVAMEIPSLNRNYCADIFGNIWSRAANKRTWKKLTGSPTGKGYLSITPAVNGKYKTKLIHRLVAEAFYGFEPEGYKQVRHLDGDQLNNKPDNLDWGTQQDNWSDRLVHGRNLGEDHHAAKLTRKEVDEIRDSSAPQSFLSARYKVSQANIWGIKNNIIWVGNPKANPPNFPRWTKPTILEITGIRVERLNDISDEDAIKEGVLPNCTAAVFKGGKWDIPKFNGCPRQTSVGCDDSSCKDEWASYPLSIDHQSPEGSAWESFKSLWESINGPGSWAANPWLFVVSFERVK